MIIRNLTKLTKIGNIHPTIKYNYREHTQSISYCRK